MHLECPHCRTGYDIDQHIDDALFVCLRCHKEFSEKQGTPLPDFDLFEPPEHLAEQAAPSNTADHQLSDERASDVSDLDRSDAESIQPSLKPSAVPEPEEDVPRLPESQGAADPAPGSDKQRATSQSDIETRPENDIDTNEQDTQSEQPDEPEPAENSAESGDASAIEDAHNEDTEQETHQPVEKQIADDLDAQTAIGDQADSNELAEEPDSIDAREHSDNASKYTESTPDPDMPEAAVDESVDIEAATDTSEISESTTPRNEGALNQDTPEEASSDASDPAATNPDGIADADAAACFDRAPARKGTSIWIWLIVITTLLTMGGFWLQKDAWLDNRKVRSTLIDLGFDLPQRARDWRIDPASVKPEWISREDNTRLLLIHGRIENLLDTPMPMPAIRLRFFATNRPEQELGSTVLELRKAQPLQQQGVPFRMPESMHAHSYTSGEKAFTIVAASVPEQTGDFTLTPVIR